MVIQKKDSTNQKVISIMSIFENDYTSNKGVIVRSVTGAYNKVYYGYVVESGPVNITDLAFQTIRIFE